MGWRREEVWLESELSWFRERALEVVTLPGLAAPAFAGVGEPTVFGPVANGLAESRRRRDELRRRRTRRRTRTAALVIGPAVALSVAAPKLTGGARGAGALAEDPPSLTIRLGADVAPPHVLGRAGAGGGRAAAAPLATAPSTATATIEWNHATSHGLPYAGWLTGGTQLPLEGPDWVTWNPVEDHRPNRPGRLFGNERTIRAILSVVATHRAAHPDAPRVLVGDISLRDGGPIDEHRSHQNGLDVDVYYPRLDRALRTPVSPEQVDRRLAQDLLDRFVAAGAQMVFVGYETGLRGPSGVVIPYPNHENHMHIRFRNPGG